MSKITEEEAMRLSKQFDYLWNPRGSAKELDRNSIDEKEKKARGFMALTIKQIMLFHNENKKYNPIYDRGEAWVEREHQRARGQHVSVVRTSSIGDVLPLKTI